MLTYVSTGPRDFGARPLTPYRRPVWEFYVGLRGRIAPVLAADLPVAPLAENVLWLLPPGSTHGWRGRATVAVFHFDHLPAELAERAGQVGGIKVKVNRAEVGRIGQLAREIQPLFWADDPLLRLHAERAVLELSILMLKKLLALPGTPDLSAEARVKAAERWFAANLAKHPGVDAIACHLGLSQAHLRRLFMVVRGVGPKAALEHIRIERAERLLAADDLKLDAVAAAAGFASASVFIQAFRKARGVTPDVWRQARAALA